MRVLFIGDIFGEAGREYLELKLPIIKLREKIDFCIANGENASHGRGLSENNYKALISAGADMVTMGNHVFGNAEFAEYSKYENKIIRPANIGKNLPGRGYAVTEVNGTKVGVANIEGRVFIDLVGDNPFECADELIKKMDEEGAKIKIIDFHAEPTSEKKIMGLYTDGRVSAVVGTHTHVQTADEQILPKGTGFITDVGMTGISKESVLGMNYKGVSEKIIKGLPSRFEPLENGTKELNGVIIDIDENSGKTIAIRRIRE